MKVSHLRIAVICLTWILCGFKSTALPGPNTQAAGGAFPKSEFVLVTVGNSIVDGGAYGWAAQLPTMFAAAGLPTVSYNRGHSGANTPGLTSLISNEVDALHSVDKNNVLVFQEVINDLISYDGPTCYQHVKTYMQTLQHSDWFKIVIMPTPRDDGYVTQPQNENRRQAFLAMVDADPTFGGTVNAVYRVDRDTRIGCAACDADTTYYVGDLVHWAVPAHAIAAGALMEILEQHDPRKFAFRPMFTPNIVTGVTAADTFTVRDAVGAPAYYGEAIQVVREAATTPLSLSGDLVQYSAPAQPTHSGASMCGRPAFVLNSAGKYVLGASVTVRGGTAFTTVKLTPGTPGGPLFLIEGQTLGRRLYAPITGDGGVQFRLTTYEYNSVVGSLQCVPTPIDDGRTHLLTWQWDGTNAGQKVWIDGVAQPLSTYLSFNGDPGTGPEAAPTYVLGGPGANGPDGLMGDLYISGNILNDHERQRMEHYLGQWRCISGVP